MNEPSVFLSPEVTRENALTLIQWLEDDEVRKFLSDSDDVSDNIEQAVKRVNLPVLTHLFSQNGRFYMAYNKQNMPVGFVRLVKKGAQTEIVVVIGDRNKWGKKLGTSTVRESLKIAFFEFRSEKVIAKIHSGNIRSIRTFITAGFKLEHEATAVKTFTITMDEYLQSIRARSIAASEIYITEMDRDRLKNMIDRELYCSSQMDRSICDLEQELNKAKIVQSQQISGDIITMNSKVLLHLDDNKAEVSLVYPQHADSLNKKISILSPVGTAILGYSEGNKILWEVSSRTTEIYIEKILYQPEAAGDYHL